MMLLFYTAAAVAILATLMVITRTNVVHALLYFIVSLIAVAVVFYTLGATFAAALEVIVYAGAIMVLFLFVMMMLNLGQSTQEQEKVWLKPRLWLGPCLLSLPLLVELVWMIRQAPDANAAHSIIEARDIGAALFGPYVLAVELASLLLLAGLVAANHLARREDRS
ncbi:NADH-quinone oxidoreductase subunit J [Pseudohongiella nitratireducens]|uniref:NADH-quinone oxidoreductase subunit J n=1 Tax=Pseudohongiella nitratireducens TaxID=1768907 RepID=A0A916QMU6_9GAMM|nr:NADH-quinone oxidoreductase subunit J [Pseudohongiella nitratireducens]GFZ83133.1 NADH-quinone oxidoreductase subunit J [Pseudohongiella nitratireducens]